MNIDNYTERLQDAARKAGFSFACYGQVGRTGLPVLERFHADGAPEVYISTGVHGDEPAGPMALLDLLQQNSLPAGANYTLFPLVNPTGLAAGSRENAGGIDINRDYGPSPRSYEARAHMDALGSRTFGLTLCLHEDYDGEGFYLYAHARNAPVEPFSRAALAAAAPHTGIDQRTCIDDMPALNGRMFPPESVMDAARNDLPEALLLFHNHAAQVTITTETPSMRPISNRIAAQRAAVLAILDVYLKPPKP